MTAGSTKSIPLTVERWSLSKLKPYHRNARRHPPEQIEQLRRALREYGFTVPMLVREDGTLIAGHGRFEAAKAEGFTDAPVIVARGWSDDQCRAYSLIDNRLSEQSTWDSDAVAEELQALSANGVDLGFYGFGDEGTDESSDEIEVREVETGPVDDMFWISVRGPLEHQAKALQRMQDILAEFPGVDVELGTIAYD